jgi:hypothetical protein
MPETGRTDTPPNDGPESNVPVPYVLDPALSPKGDRLVATLCGGSQSQALSTIGNTGSSGEQTGKGAEDKIRVLKSGERYGLLHEIRKWCDEQKIGDWPALERLLETASEAELYGIVQMQAAQHLVRPTRVDQNGQSGYRFDSCSKESPLGSRNVTYDQAVALAKEWGADLMDENVFEGLKPAHGFDKDSIDMLKTTSGQRENGIVVFGSANGIGYTPVKPDYRAPRIGFRCSKFLAEAKKEQ